MVVISRNLLQRSLSILSNIPTQSCRSRLRMDCRCLESLHTNGNSETNHVHTVLAFGDSNTWGFDPSSPGNGAATLRHPYRSRWTTQISEILKQHVHIVPEGLNARTTVLRDPMSPCDGKLRPIENRFELRWSSMSFSRHVDGISCLCYQVNIIVKDVET